jgi:hypothetical protein
MDDALTVGPLPINEVRWRAVLAGMAVGMNRPAGTTGFRERPPGGHVVCRALCRVTNGASP